MQLWEDVEETLRHLRRMGFVAYQVLCGPLLKPLYRPLSRPLSHLRRMGFVAYQVTVPADVPLYPGPYLSLS